MDSDVLAPSRTSRAYRAVACRPALTLLRATLYNRIEQDHRRIKRRIRSMLGFKSTASAAAILSGIEMVNDGPTFRAHFLPHKKIEFFSGNQLVQTDGCR